MMIYERPLHDAALPGPGSPPGMTASKSSKSSSLTSLHEDDGSVLADASHFEDIGLDDAQLGPRGLSDHHVKDPSAPYSRSFSDLRAVTKRPVSASAPPTAAFAGPVREPSEARRHASRQVTPDAPGPAGPAAVDERTHCQPGPAARPSSHPQSQQPAITVVPEPTTKPQPRPVSQTPSVASRRSSWQSNRERKSVLELELECDEDDGDEIPDGLVLDNVPISPRPPSERSRSRPSSKAPSPERAPKEKVRSVGNGTPPVALAQGSLRSPTWKSESAGTSRATSPVTAKAKGWSAAMAELSAEAKELTEKLEEHAEQMELKAQRCSTGSMPNPRRSSAPDSKPRVKSALAELPPLRRSNIMIDPLPISKEKEAVLSRTRPSWLPPKDPAEERRHLKEYQKMMAQSLEADRRRQAAKRARSENRDVAADSVMQIWEREIIPRWNEAIRERRTRDMWWRGIAPRSRGVVWMRAIGNDLGLTKTSFEAALGRARDAEAQAKSGHGSAEDMRAASWFGAISRDVRERTWPDLRIFQPGGPLHQSLVDVLRAYSMYRSDIGYVPGCNTIAALLLLNLPTPTDAFIALANVLNRPLPLSFIVSDAAGKQSAYNLVLHTLSKKSPALHEHLTAGLPDRDADAYLRGVFTALFTRHLALDEATRLWDVYVFEGDALLVRAAVALLLRKEMALLATKSVDEVRAVLDGGPRVVGPDGEEERFMAAVREAGKA